MVDALADEFELVDVALAAVKLAHEASGATDDDEEIPDIATREKHTGKGDKWDKGGKGKDGKSWDKDKPGKGYQGKKDSATSRAAQRPRGPQGDVPASTSASAAATASARRTSSAPSPARPTCAATTSAPSASSIGSPWSRCPTDSVDRVIDAMKATTIRGKKAAVRKDRGDHD